jgi:hypothetical protein
VSIQGSLEDVGVADVMQFVHLGSSTGTLVLTSDSERVEIGFHEGGVINAWDSKSLRLGELLVSRELVSKDALDCALAMQAAMPEPVLSIGEILMRERVLDPDDLREAVIEQIRGSVSRAVEWNQGSFVFHKGPPRRRDEFDPDAVLEYKLNTQGLLLELARTLDHARRGITSGEHSDLLSEEPDRVGAGVAAARTALKSILGRPEAEPRPTTATSRSATTSAGVARRDTAAKPAPRLPSAVAPPTAAAAPASQQAAPPAPGADAEEQDAGEQGALLENEVDWRPLVRVISDDRTFDTRYLPDLGCDVEVIPFHEISWLSHHAPASVLVVDMRPNRHISELGAITSMISGLSPVVLLPDVSKAAAVYGLGARAVIPDQPAALASYVRGMITRLGAAGQATLPRPRPESRGFNRLREILADLRGSAPSATRILSLMRVVSDFAERAAIFVVTGNQARIIGAFGKSASGTPLVDVLRRGGTFPLTGAFAEAIENRAILTSAYQPEDLPAGLAAALGPPGSSNYHLVPITGSEAVLLLIYVDNGDLPRPVEGLDVIELAGAQIGLMFENEVLKRRTAGSRGDGHESPGS